MASQQKEVRFLDKLGFLLSKKILVVLSGLIFTGVAFASSGAQSLLQNSGATPETKIPEVQKVTEDQQPPKTSSPVSLPKQETKPVTPPTANTITTTPKPLTNSNIQLPTPTATPKAVPTTIPTAAPKLNTITGLGQSGSTDKDVSDGEKEKADDSGGSAINKAFQTVKDGN